MCFTLWITRGIACGSKRKHTSAWICVIFIIRITANEGLSIHVNTLTFGSLNWKHLHLTVLIWNELITFKRLRSAYMSNTMKSCDILLLNNRLMHILNSFLQTALSADGYLHLLTFFVFFVTFDGKVNNSDLEKKETGNHLKCFTNCVNS